MDFTALLAEYIKPELLIIAVLCYAAGMFLKGTSLLSDKWIPLALLAFGIILGILYIAIMLDGGWTAKVILGGFIQGLLCAALAVYANQLIKQANKME
jgi:hypothetical protein